MSLEKVSAGQPGLAPALPLGEETAKLTLHRLSLRNFMGIKEFDLVLDGEDVRVYGKNATGKTTLFTAFTWLFFDKDSQNRKEFEIKPLKQDGEPVHFVESEVEGACRFKDRAFTLKKVYREKWVKQRGEAEREFQGHESLYYIDGVPKKKQEYDAFIASIVDEKVFRLLSDPSYFNEQLHWQDRRKLLLEVCGGDVSDEDVMASDDRLAELKEIVGNRQVADHKKVVLADRAKVNKTLAEIPVRISEAERGLPMPSLLPKQPESDVRSELEGLRSDRRAKSEEIVRAEQGGEVAELETRLRQTQASLLDLENRHRTAVDAAISEKRLKFQEASFALQNAEREARGLSDDLAQAQSRLQKMDARLEEMRGQFRAVDAEEFVHEDRTVCPTCGQALPEDRVAEAREKALEAFNLSKSQRLEKIQAEGKALRAERDTLQEEVGRCQKALDACAQRQPALQKQVAALRGEIDKLQADRGKLPQTPEHIRMASERDRLQERIDALRAGRTGDLAPLKAEVAALDQEIASHERALAIIDERRRGEARIEELKAEEKRLAAELRRLERELSLADDFTRAKVRLLEDRINAKFVYARFKMFDVQVNGGIDDCCETTYKGVPFNTNLNKGARINVGLDIVRTLSEHYGYAVPVWLDNREALTSLIEMETQVISLVVSEKDEVLRVERG